MREHEPPPLPFVVPAWQGKNIPVHGFFTRRGGVSPPPYASLNVGHASGDETSNIRENLRRIARLLEIPPEKILWAEQVHGDRVLEVSGGLTGPAAAGRSGRIRPPFQADGLMTGEPGLYLGVLTADCLPLLFFDPRLGVVAAVHAGWRGTLRRIAARAVDRLARTFGCRPTDLEVACGASIGPCCYEVGHEVAERFLEAERGYTGHVRRTAAGRWHLDLYGINRHQMIEAGIRGTRIFHLPLCTRCRPDLFFSVRAQGKVTGRQIALIGIRPPFREAKETRSAPGIPFPSAGRENET